MESRITSLTGFPFKENAISGDPSFLRMIRPTSTIRFSVTNAAEKRIAITTAGTATLSARLENKKLNPKIRLPPSTAKRAHFFIVIFTLQTIALSESFLYSMRYCIPDDSEIQVVLRHAHSSISDCRVVAVATLK